MILCRWQPGRVGAAGRTREMRSPEKDGRGEQSVFPRWNCSSSDRTNPLLRQPPSFHLVSVTQPFLFLSFCLLDHLLSPPIVCCCGGLRLPSTAFHLEFLVESRLFRPESRPLSEMKLSALGNLRMTPTTLRGRVELWEKNASDRSDSK